MFFCSGVPVTLTRSEHLSEMSGKTLITASEKDMEIDNYYIWSPNFGRRIMKLNIYCVGARNGGVIPKVSALILIGDKHEHI